MACLVPPASSCLDAASSPSPSAGRVELWLTARRGECGGAVLPGSLLRSVRLCPFGAECRGGAFKAQDDRGRLPGHPNVAARRERNSLEPAACLPEGEWSIAVTDS
mmetsp:Transcript_73670/g.219894  ORF Transcript_73670/g.219894 Transcript_73670/m.219894 type:complete len:106 (+) Transcript_73670:63-380(+)